MDVCNQIYILISLMVCFGVYKLFKKHNKTRAANSLWLPEDEKALMAILERIYSSTNVNELLETFCMGVRSLPRYYDLIELARDERRQQLLEKTSVSSFEETESKIRRIWLWSFFAYYIFNGFLMLANAFIISSVEKNYWSGLGDFLLFVAFVGLIMLLIYHCAYYKKGTGWLSCIVFAGPLRWLSDFAKNGAELSVLDLPGIAIYIFFLISCIRLRKSNSEAKARRQLAGLKAIMA